MLSKAAEIRVAMDGGVLAIKGIKTVFVTGAAGFIGGRIVERLYLSGLAKVRAGIHRWSTAARIARFPVEIVECNVLDKDRLPYLIEGSDFVVHCAYGDRHVTEEGTRNVLQAALEVGVKRFVHLSTVEVYGNVSGQIDESAPLRYSGNEYADSKINAEKFCGEYQAKGLPIVILRPTVVYGPFGKVWTTSIAERLLLGRWRLPEHISGFCQPVYVDDLVSAILLALRKDSAVGEVFNIAGSEVLTWDEFFKQFNAALGLPSLKMQSRLSAYLKTVFMTPIRAVARYAVCNYPELIKKVLMKLHLEDIAKQAEVLIRTSLSLEELSLYRRKAIYSIDKSRRILEYSPSIDLIPGLQLTALWLKHHGYESRVQ